MNYRQYQYKIIIIIVIIKIIINTDGNLSSRTTKGASINTGTDADQLNKTIRYSLFFKNLVISEKLKLYNFGII